MLGCGVGMAGSLYYNFFRVAMPLAIVLLLCSAAKKGPGTKKSIEEKKEGKERRKKTKEDEKMMVFLGTRSKMRKHFVRLERSLAN